MSRRDSRWRGRVGGGVGGREGGGSLAGSAGAVRGSSGSARTRGQEWESRRGFGAEMERVTLYPGLFLFAQTEVR